MHVTAASTGSKMRSSYKYVCLLLVYSEQTLTSGLLRTTLYKFDILVTFSSYCCCNLLIFVEMHYMDWATSADSRKRVVFVRATVSVKMFHLVEVDSGWGEFYILGEYWCFSGYLQFRSLVQSQHNIMWQKAQIYAVEYNYREVLFECN